MDFKNTVIIMTTNLGTRDISKGFNLGFAAQGDVKTNYERMKVKVNEELGSSTSRPEFLNRVDDTVVFHQLTEEDIIQIVDLMLAKVDERLKDRDMGIELSGEAKTLLAKKGYDPVMGARPLRRTIERQIEDVLSEKILFGELRPGSHRGSGHGGRGRRQDVHLPRRGEVGSARRPPDRAGGRQLAGPNLSKDA
ncbi:ATP-dependent Clp protease ATP-binding protein [Streptomyces badius]